MTLNRYIQLGLAATLAVVLLIALQWRGERDDLRTAVSIAAHAADAKGRPVTISTKGAIDQVRILGNAVDAIKLASAEAAAGDAQNVITVERKDAQTIQEVSTHVQAQLDRTRDALADSRALAAQRLRALAEARSDPGGGDDAAIAAAPDAVCGAAFAASCDEVLALLAEAEINTAKLIGWQQLWPRVKANHDGAGEAPATSSAAQPLDQLEPPILVAGEASEVLRGVGAHPDADRAPATAARALQMGERLLPSGVPPVAAIPARGLTRVDRADVAARAADAELPTLADDVL